MTLIVTNATLIGYEQPQMIKMAAGQVVEVAPASASSTEQRPDSTDAPIDAPVDAPIDAPIDAQGRLVIPGLVDGHFHLDKALLLPQHPAQDGTFAEALRETLALKQVFTQADVQHRARRILETAIAFGTTAMRSHVEVDPVIGLLGMEALLPLKQDYAWGTTLQLAVFAQEGITNQPGTEDLLRQALGLGGDVIGSAPYVDPNPERNIQIIFDIAQDFDCDVDFHLDFLDDDQPLLLPVVIRETMKRGWQGRVCVGHMTRLAGLPPESLQTIAQDLREADISILALPASDLYMMARKDAYNVRRGVAPIHQLIEWGVNAGIAINNVQNLFTPFGDGDLLKLCTLTAQVLQLGTPAAHEQCLAMATTRAAKAIGLNSNGSPTNATAMIVPGQAADLVILDAQSASEAIATAPPGRTVIKRGQVVSQTQVQQQFVRPA
jgi:cytosine deaminase